MLSSDNRWHGSQYKKAVPVIIWIQAPLSGSGAGSSSPQCAGTSVKGTSSFQRAGSSVKGTSWGTGISCRSSISSAEARDPAARAPLA